MFGIGCVSRFVIMSRKKTNLNIQYPTPILIKFEDLQWTEKTRQRFANSCLIIFVFILWECVPDFIDGQGLEFEGKVRWNIVKAIVGEKHIQRLQIDYFITHTYYECAYGAEDYRFDHLHKRSIKKSCLARFSMKQYYMYSDVAEIVYYIVEYKRKDGSIAHGPKVPDSTCRKSQFEPRISKQLVVWFKDQSDKGHTLKYIMKSIRIFG